MRYIAKVLKSSLHKKFPDASEDELLKVETLQRLCLFVLPTRSPALYSSAQVALRVATITSQSSDGDIGDVTAFLSGRL